MRYKEVGRARREASALASRLRREREALQRQVAPEGTVSEGRESGEADERESRRRIVNAIVTAVGVAAIVAVFALLIFFEAAAWW